MINQTIEQLIRAKNMNISQAKQLMLNIMNGAVNPARLAAILIALKCKGETADEVAGFAQAMREKSVRLPVKTSEAIDLCGTGGDGKGTFNISTAAAFVVAAAGIPVAKHGNRAVSSRSGSADVLQQLGINIELEPEYGAQALEETGITFMFAPMYHPAMKHVAQVRRELGIKTVFNMLGPLTNPAQTRRQLVGTFNHRAAHLMAEAAKHLGMQRVCFVCTEDQYDEISLSAATRVIEFNKAFGSKTYEVSPGDFGFPEIRAEQLDGGSPEENAQILYNVLKNPDPGPVYFVTAANAAMAMFCAGYSSDLKECARAACDKLDSGQAFRVFEKLREFSNDHS